MIKYALLISSLFMFSAGSFAKDGPCKADKEKYCSTCTKGDKDCFKKCMKENEDKLSAECKAKIEAKKKEKSKKST